MPEVRLHDGSTIALGRRLLEGMDHIQAMQAANVLPVIRPWLISTLASVRGLTRYLVLA